MNFIRVRRLVFRAFKRGEVQISAREFSDGLNVSCFEAYISHLDACSVTTHCPEFLLLRVTRLFFKMDCLRYVLVPGKSYKYRHPLGPTSLLNALHLINFSTALQILKMSICPCEKWLSHNNHINSIFWEAHDKKREGYHCFIVRNIKDEKKWSKNYFA